MIYKVKKGSQQQIKQPITTANERVTRASAVISFRPNCCWSECWISSFVNEWFDRQSNWCCLRKCFRCDEFVFSLYSELKQHGNNDLLLDGLSIDWWTKFSVCWSNRSKSQQRFSFFCFCLFNVKPVVFLWSWFEGFLLIFNDCCRIAYKTLA